MSKLITIGHKNPDTDSIISAIVAQEYFEKALGIAAQACRAGEINNETKFVLGNVGMAVPMHIAEVGEVESVALVDHNEASQIADGFDYGKVEYIIDHHKISVQTEKPISCRVEPIGSTSSLLAQMFFEKNIKPSEVAIKLLLAGILSDTLNLTSPTTTETDKQLVEKLSAAVEFDKEKFVEEMFKAKSSLDGISVADIVSIDYKTFEMGSKNVGIGTWETTLPESVEVKKTEILEALRAKKNAEKLDYVFFMVVDILKQNCQLYLIEEAEKELAEQVFGGKADGDSLVLAGVVSRKKQIVPPLTEILAKV